MQYGWLAIDPDQPFPTERLGAEDVPPPLISSGDFDAVNLLNRFAHTFSGYDWAGSLEELRDRYQRTHRPGSSPSDLDRTGSTPGGFARVRRTPRDPTRIRGEAALLRLLRLAVPLGDERLATAPLRSRYKVDHITIAMELVDAAPRRSPHSPRYTFGWPGVSRL